MLENIKVNGELLRDAQLNTKQSDKNVTVELVSGSYEFNYLPEVAYIK